MMKIKYIIALSSLMSIFAFVVIMVSPVATAITGSDWRSSKIVDDNVFFNPNGMSPDDIQIFLNSKVPSCDTMGTKPSGYGNTRAEYGASRGYPAPFTCLKDYYENPSTHQNNLSGNPIPAGGKSAAQIIFDVSQQFSVSPKALLVTLQKESDNLIFDDWPFPSQYRAAMGYGCPDTAPCDSEYYGFYNQMYNAAKQFRRYATYPNEYRYRAQQNNFIQYNPNVGCGGTNVFIENQATAGLYNYTPYQPNAAALNNLYGTGDSCSAYGNRNFWRIHYDWFGSPYSWDTVSPHPDGTLINLDNSIYLIENGKRRHVGGGAVFDSYRYDWNRVKPATSGDRQLVTASGLYNLNPERLYYSDGSPVYVLLSTDGNITWQKQPITYEAFTKLGYMWSDVMRVNPSELPQTTSPGNYFEIKHRNGDLISMQGKVYYIDHNTRRYVSGAVFRSHLWPWQVVMPASSLDSSIPEGERMLYKEGSVLYDGSNLYIVKIPPTGYEIKKPIGPWECYALSFRYNTDYDPFRVSTSELPTSTGPRVSCN